MSVIEALVSEFARLPGIGRKTAQRLTYHLLQQPPERSLRLAEALDEVARRVHPCAECGNLFEGDRCEVCGDPRRDPTLLCVVEEASTVGALDRAGFRGRYLVLGGRLAPLDGVGPAHHTFQDTFSHEEGWAGPIKHIFDALKGKSPDDTSKRVELALEAATATYEELGGTKPLDKEFLRQVLSEPSSRKRIAMLEKQVGKPKPRPQQHWGMRPMNDVERQFSPETAYGGWDF